MYGNDNAKLQTEENKARTYLYATENYSADSDEYFKRVVQSILRVPTTNEVKLKFLEELCKNNS